jgi:hypothetical protein
LFYVFLLVQQRNSEKAEGRHSRLIAVYFHGEQNPKEGRNLQEGMTAYREEEMTVSL